MGWPRRRSSTCSVTCPPMATDLPGRRAAGAVGGYVVALAPDRGWQVTGLARSEDEDFVRGLGADFTADDQDSEHGWDVVADAAVLQELALVLVRGDAPGRRAIDRAARPGPRRVRCRLVCTPSCRSTLSSAPTGRWGRAGPEVATSSRRDRTSRRAAVRDLEIVFPVQVVMGQLALARHRLILVLEGVGHPLRKGRVVGRERTGRRVSIHRDRPPVVGHRQLEQPVDAASIEVVHAEAVGVAEDRVSRRGTRGGRSGSGRSGTPRRRATRTGPVP